MNVSITTRQFLTLTNAIALTAALLLASLASAVLIGWYFGYPLLVNLSFNAAMNEKTALCFLFSAIGIFSLSRERYRRFATVSAVVVALIALISYIPSLGQAWNTHVASFIKGDLPVAKSRMSIYTSLSFFLIAMSLATTSFIKLRTKIFALGVFGPLITAVGAAALFCYVLEILPKGGAGLGSVAIHTSIGIFVSGVGITALELRSSRKRLIRWLPLLAGVIAMIIVTVIWQSLLSSKDVDEKILRVILYGGFASAGLVISMSYFSLRLYRINDTLESRVQSRTQELAKANAELQRFSAVAAHDLRSPVSTMVSYAQLCVDEMETDPESVQFYATKVTEIGKRSLRLIDNLLQLARAGNMPTQFEQLSFQKILDYVTANLKGKIDETGARILSSAQAQICGDEMQLIQLFQNLIANSLKFTAPGVTPTIEILSLDVGPLTEFVLKDNGVGIPADQAEKVFEVFGRSDSTASYEGSGLGLSVCKRIVETHGGKIWFQSEPGVGTDFHFTLKKPS